MKIIYKPSEKSERTDILNAYGFSQCFFKRIAENKDERFVTKKEHSNAGYEIHILTRGTQVYEFFGERISISGGEFLLIPPRVKHKIIESSFDVCKYGITFTLLEGSGIFDPNPKTVRDFASSEVLNLCKNIYAESKGAKRLSEILIENMIFELLVRILRASGFCEKEYKYEAEGGDARLELAKKYIKDNIESTLTVSDVASYCYLSEKQLTRIFIESEGVSPGDYIKRKRASAIAEMLSGTSLSLKEISRVMNFNNEYYFNSFFKRYCGMTPGDYRKSNVEK